MAESNKSPPEHINTRFWCGGAPTVREDCKVKQIVPIVLTALMLTSVFAGIDFADELKETNDMDTSGRADYELKLHDVVEPRVTLVDQAENTRNGIDVGDVVHFRPIVINEGDNDQDEFNIRVTVTPAADSSILLIDTLDDAVCPGDVAVTGCSYNSLASGDFLGGGNYRVQAASGGDLSWTPTVPGEYTVTIGVETVDSAHDVNLTNNEESYNVTVQHYTDIEVSLCWTDGPGGACSATQGAVSGTGPHNFALTANVSGSEAWTARETTIDVTFDGAFDPTQSSLDADGDGGQDAQAAAYTVVLGSDAPTAVDVFHNTSEPGQTSAHLDNPCSNNANPCNQTRNVATYGQVYTFHGVITGDSGSAGGIDAMSVSAVLNSFVSYEVHEETYSDPNDPTDETPSRIMSEVTMDYDDRTGNNADSLAAYFSVFHDVAITSLTGGENEATEGTLNVGANRLTASVSPMGSDSTNLYDWAVTFSVRDEDGNEMLQDGLSTSCLDDNYDHLLLGIGDGAAPEGTACINHDFAPGRYTVTATIELLDTNDDGWADMNAGNNMLGTFFEVVNDIPTVYVSLDSVSRDGEGVSPPVITGDSVTLHARGADTETSDDALLYTWMRASALGGTEEIPCEEGPGSSVCTVETDVTWIGVRKVTATVEDGHMASSSDSMLLSVWNHYSTSMNATGATMDYSLVYGPAIAFTVTAADAAQVTGAVLGENAGSFDSVVAFELTASNIFSPDSIGAESFTVNFDGDAANPYDLWYLRAGGAEWTPMGTAASAGATGGVTLTYAHDGSQEGNLQSGTYAVFEISSAGGDPPATGISGLSATLMPDARVEFSWDLSDSGSANENTDSVHIYYCAGDGCDALSGTHVPGQNITTDSWPLIGTDGESYTVLVRVENGNTDANGDTLAGDPVQSLTVIADGSVSPEPTLADATGAGSSDGLTISWTATGTDDVSAWMVCWAASQDLVENDFGSRVSEFQQSGDSCAQSADTTTSMTMTEDTMCGGDCSAKLYFGIAGVDEVGNVASPGATHVEDMSTGLEIPDPTDPPIEEPGDGGDAQANAMYAIIALVVLAVIGGAFILTRGGGEEGGDKEWDY